MKPSKDTPQSHQKPQTPQVDQTPEPATSPTSHGLTIPAAHGVSHETVPAPAITSPAPVVTPGPTVPAVSALGRHNVTVPPPSELTLRYGPKQPTRNVGQAYPKVVYKPRVGSVPLVDDTQTVASLQDEKEALAGGWKLTPSPVPVDEPIQPLSAEELRVLVHLIERMTKKQVVQTTPPPPPAGHVHPAPYPKVLYRQVVGSVPLVDETRTVHSAHEEEVARADGWVANPDHWTPTPSVTRPKKG